MSQIAEEFIKAYSVKMRGGTLRFQAQYLRKIAVPEPRSITQDVAHQLRQAFRQRDRVAATHAAIVAYELSNQKDLYIDKR